MVTIVTVHVNLAGAGYDSRMGLGRHLARGEQLELPPTRRAGFTLVVYHTAPNGTEVFLARAGETWSLPRGAARLAETPHEASERFLRDEWAANLATFEIDGERAEPVFAAEAEAADSGQSAPIQADGEWFGLGKVRALALGEDGMLIERLLGSLD